ncbi:galactomannan galactosyltransferase 1-like [Cornus florida]|uniref:galactomannan galactosyltransferase 1-like n=1 Tax=Cornus florida TaxID=4283 RepID=UPI00289AE6E1|nr:galactomannan galactosyltransferase 1-like [Cornus florida]
MLSRFRVASRKVSKFQTPSMAKFTFQNKVASFFRLRFVGGVLVALLLVWAICSFEPWHHFSRLLAKHRSNLASELVGTKDCADGAQGVNLIHDPPETTFYDDPNLSYSIGKPIKGWDEKRREWLMHHPSYVAGARDRVFVVSGSQPSACRNPIGDHFLLRLFKNKVDYCRIHGYDIFYNNALLHPNMHSFWAKIPVVRATMVAHPEAEWIWWVDSDAVFTDMDFKLPLEKYKDHNLVVDGWPGLIYEHRSWVGLNAGVLLIRNCQWSIDFMEVWASMGPQTPNYEKWGETFKSALKDKEYPESDDQSALVYLMLEGKDTWATKIYLENQYCFQGYWVGLVGTLYNITDKYAGIEKVVRRLRRRHAEKVSEGYGALWERHLDEAGYWKETGRRPFITHFTGCQPCSGDHNPAYGGDSCWKGLERALNFADNQVLRRYGFVHQDLLDLSSVSSVPFDFPA